MKGGRICSEVGGRKSSSRQFVECTRLSRGNLESGVQGLNANAAQLHVVVNVCTVRCNCYALAAVRRPSAVARTTIITAIMTTTAQRKSFVPVASPPA